MAAHVQNTPLKLSDEAPIFFGKANFHLTNSFTFTTLDTLNRQSYHNQFEAKAGSQESSPRSATLDHLPGTATWASQSGRILFNGENDLLADVFGLTISIPNDIQGVVQ
jgi:hypothetical protein